MLRISLIVTGGFIQHSNEKKAALESERLLALNTCLMNLGLMSRSMQTGDEIVLAEYGLKSRLKNLCETHLKNVNHQYVFVEGSGFNQSKIKNAGAEAAKGDIVCWINSDVILQQNFWDVLRSRFERNRMIFATAARHDVFNIESKYQFFDDINDDAAYVIVKDQLDDAGWHHALRKPQTPIPTSYKAFVHPRYTSVLSTLGLPEKNGHIIHDFGNGYMNYGELMAVTKDIWQKYPFDEEITAIVDSFLRDIIFGNEPVFGLELIHDETAVFHLSGSDFMGQTQSGSDKYARLIEDMIKAAKKYPCMQHWLVFSYFREFEDTIKELNIPFKEIFETWRTPFMWRYFRDKERVKELYGVSDE